MTLLVCILLGGVGSGVYALLGYLDGKVRKDELFQGHLMLRAVLWGLIAGWVYAHAVGYPEQLDITLMAGALGSGMISDSIGRKGLSLFLLQLQRFFENYFQKE
ncbi:MAG: hypothetical protein QXE50_08110 [Nitrososphaerota archaeon]